jgi:hypothetical protein
MRKLDSFKIRILLSGDQKTLVSLLLERFHVRSFHIWSTPELDSQILTIHPADFINLISFVEPGDCTELEFYRLRKLGWMAIESTLDKIKSPTSKELQDMTLYSLNQLVPQEYIAEPFQELEIPDTI